MGKSNKANRTKGNTRPSSSGHSAELLGVSGQPLTGFVGFDALDKDTASYVPVTGQHATEAADSSVDSDFRMVMRKMLKRDAVTRLKAVQEFGEHCVEKEVDVVKNVLPFWPRLFNKLALDSDRRIREATHQSNGKLLSKVKREMAPYLKNIMGVWLLGQCDLYAPSSSAAQAVFSTTFPTNKQSEAVIFCKNEIFLYFKDNLFEQTAKTMSDPSVATAEDIENKYILVISATLQALKLILSLVPKNELSNVHDSFYSIVAENKFWKYAKSKEPSIRGAWYALISSMCQQRPDLFKEMEKKLATTVFSCLSESDPSVAPAVWESALSVVINFENCWQEIDVYKVALPQLWILLKEGGKGNARVLFPCLLPFLSKLPKEILETEDFLVQFFSCFRQSLTLQSVKSSAIECDAILMAFFECLQYICCSLLGNENIGPKLLKHVLINEVIPMLKASFYDENNSHLATSKLYMLLGTLVRKLECLSCNENEKLSEDFKNIQNEFWEEVLPITLKLFSIEEKKKNSALIYISFFFCCILQPTEYSVKQKKGAVRFKEEGEDEDKKQDEVTTEECSLVVKISNSESLVMASDKKSQSFSHILKFCKLLCDKIDANCEHSYLRLFEELLASAASSDFLMELIRITSESQTFEKSALSFVQQIVLEWIKKIGGDMDCLLCVFNIIFIICSFVPEDEAKDILNCCCKLPVSEVECMIKTGLGRYREAPFLLNWLKTSTWSSDVVSGLQQLVDGNRFYNDNSAILEIQMYQRLLKMCQEDALAGILVPEQSFKEIIKLLGVLLEQLFKKEMKSKRIDLGLYFIHDVFIAILKNHQICWKFESVEDFVYQLFCASLHDTVDLKNGDEVSGILFEILGAFIDSYVQEKDEIMNEESVIFKIGKELNSSIHSLKSQKEGVCVEKHCSFFLASVEKYLAVHKPHLYSTLFISYKLMDVILPSADSWNSLKTKLTINITPLYLKKKIFYPLVTDEKMFYPEDIVLKFNLAANIVSSILCDESIMSKEGEENIKFLMHYINEHFAHLLWCLTFNNGTKTTVASDGNSLMEQLEQKCLKMLSILSNCAIEQLKRKLFDMSLLDENWALCLLTLSEIYPVCNLRNFADKKFDKLSKEWPGLHKYVVRQVLIHHLSTEEKKRHLKELVADLMKMKDLTDFNVPGKMGELCCYLQDKSMMEFLDVQNCLKKLFEIIIRFDFTDCNRLEYMYRLQMIHILSCEIQYGFCIISPTIWNYFTELLKNTLEKCHAKSFYDKPKSVLLLYQMTVIFISLSELFKMIQVDQPDIDRNWNPEPISDKTYASVLNLFGAVSEHFNFIKSLPEVTEVVLSKFLEALELIPVGNLLIKCQDMKTQFILNFYPQEFIPHFLMLMKSPVRQVQFGVHILFLKIMPVIPQISSERDISIEKREDEPEEEDEEIIRIPLM
ncbi:E3 ubiquitin-protein ligase listerin [Araneus ventricosus]|uniref:E3 ubiquitin-protein ligase listerin n=1 Tax=Araneus ventricosus TaxID=182803 RepID=A0A4Y2K4J8_ARAVE|nr:E3 ubiquitin-protein ligase listerin [Araneus ventricosus]